MNNNINNLTKIIVTAGAIAFFGFLPWLIINKNANKVGQFTEDLAQNKNIANLKEAMYYENLENGYIECNLCPNQCLLAEGQRGTCKVRENQGGKLYSLVYGKPVTVHVDPIEKKPLFHFLPGAQAYSMATVGCNLSCQQCQNWDISQAFPEDVISLNKSPEDIVADAIRSQAKVIAFTYSEPIIFYEYMLDIAKLAQARGLKTVMISGGYINKEPLLNLLPYLDGIKIDLKAYSDKFYTKITNGRLQPVLDTIKTIAEEGTHLEIVYLVIPGENDSEDEIRKMSTWLNDTLGDRAIIHFSRFHPDYKMLNIPPTPLSTLRRAREIALESGIKYVYTGNVEFPEAEATYCDDGSVAIQRQGYFILKNALDSGKCADGTEIPGVWN